MSTRIVNLPILFRNFNCEVILLTPIKCGDEHDIIKSDQRLFCSVVIQLNDTLPGNLWVPDL